MTGKGRYTKKNGDIYQGEFVKGQMTGKGKLYIAAAEQSFEGNFANGVLTKGKIFGKDGSVYNG